MINISSLNINKKLSLSPLAYTRADTRFVLKEVYPSTDVSDDCVLMYQSRWTSLDTFMYYWIVKYNIRQNKEVWSCRLNTKDKVHINSDGSMEFIREDNDQHKNDHVYNVNPKLFMETYGVKPCLRYANDGRIVGNSLMNRVYSKSILLSQKDQLLIWDKSRVLQLYKNLALQWKKALSTKPTDCRYHPKAGFVLFYDDRNFVSICKADSGHTNTIPLIAPAKAWCDSEDGFILSIRSTLYLLDVGKGISRPIATLPAGHLLVAMTRTNPDYFIVLTSQGYQYYYLIYSAGSGKLMNTMLSSKSSPDLNVVGIGDELVLLPDLPEHPSSLNNTMCIYDIAHGQRRYNFDPFDNSHIQPYGKNRLLVKWANKVSIYG